MMHIDVNMECSKIYVGDPCYAILEEYYDDYGVACSLPEGDGNGGIGRNPDGKVLSIIHGTANGDGVYDGFLIESGQIGVINGEICDTTDSEYDTFIDVPSGKAKIEFDYDDGYFSITITDLENDKCLFNDVINTNFTDDELDDNYEDNN